jgi:hypothetical protein
VLEPYLGKSTYAYNGERVVVGQRRMQAASDIFLGRYRSADEHDYYVRQLQDLKGSVPGGVGDSNGSESVRRTSDRAWRSKRRWRSQKRTGIRRNVITENL